MNILVAPNTFKNSLDARRVALAIETGLKQSSTGCNITRCPVGDGGDGTADLLTEQLNGERIFIDVMGPLGKPVTAPIGFVENGRVAIIELADASGLRLISPAERNPLKATTFGTGQLIASAIQHGAKKIVMGIGGSATVDGGTGILRALGYTFYDAEENELTEPASMIALHHYHTPLVSLLDGVTIHLLCDVRNHLLGQNGAAAVFGPQKGATKEMVSVLEAALQRLRDVVWSTRGIDIGEVIHGGASGGVAAGLYGIAGAELLPGIEYFLSLTRFDQFLSSTDLVITGEGSLDEQSLEGKAPVGVAALAKKAGKKVVGMAGQITGRDKLQPYFDLLIDINEGETDLAVAMQNTATNLTKAARKLGEDLAKSKLQL